MIKIWKRSKKIKQSDVNKIIQIHKGTNIFFTQKITSSMVGHRFGEYAITRKYNNNFYKRN